ncbi:hypothetical protein B0H14DRAFT_3139988 [Mycena olivaceomarginata]|nr:hypothetical protein B0H14DRAFT_3139988 [Mycena olivaceomarginata]
MSASVIPQTLGAILIGGLFATFLGGIVSLQTILYYRTYKQDPFSVKFLILAVWVLDNLHTGFIWGGLWYCLVQNYGAHDKVDSIPWYSDRNGARDIPCSLVPTSSGQTRLRGSSFLFQFLCAPHILAQQEELVYDNTRSPPHSPSSRLRYRSFAIFRLKARWIFTLGLSVSSAVDILITGFLVFLFRRNRTGTGRIDHVLDKLILYGLETGSLTCLGTIITMLLWIIKPNLIFLGLHVVIAKRTGFPVCYHRITDIRKSMQTHCSSLSTPGTTSKPLGRPALVRRETPGLFCISSPALPKKLLDTIWMTWRPKRVRNCRSMCRPRPMFGMMGHRLRVRSDVVFLPRMFKSLFKDKGL